MIYDVVRLRLLLKLNILILNQIGAKYGAKRRKHIVKFCELNDIG